MAMSREAVADQDRRVLETMTPGISHETREVATAVGLGMSHTRHILERLARTGEVVRIEPVWRGLPVGWRRG